MNVFLCSPTTGEQRMESARAFYAASTKHNVRMMVQASSNLAHSFNEMVSCALSGMTEPTDVFAMLHSDVAAPMGWLDTMIEEMQRAGAEVLSAVVPIKADCGETSTAISTGDPYKARRLSFCDLEQLPDTFCANDLVEHGMCNRGYPLLVNTGCWVADLKAPWWNRADPMTGAAYVDFQLTCRRVLREGKWIAETEPEDWRFSRLVAECGGKVYATTKVPTVHLGSKSWGMLRREKSNG